MRLAVLASHSGTILQAVIDAFDDGRVDGEVAVVVSNNSASGALRRARAARIEAVHLSSRTDPDATVLDAAICQTLRDAGVDWALLAGYMKRLGPATLAAYHGHIINTHPSLLPRHGGPGMYGLRVHQAVIDAGDRRSGATMHHVVGDYDSGPIICHAALDVAPNETAEQLEQRVKMLERELVVSALARLSDA